MGEQREKRSKVVSGLIWKSGETISAKLISFVVTLVLARLLTPSDYGLVALVLVFISIADVFMTSGFGTGLIQKSDADDVDFSTMFYFSTVCSILIYIGLFLLAPAIATFYRNDQLVLILRVFALKIPLSSVLAIQQAYVARNMLFRRMFWSTLVGTVISGVAGVLLAYLGWGVWALIAQYFINVLVSTFVLAITVPWRPRLLFSWDSARSLFGYSWKVLAADLSGVFFFQLRSLLIGRVFTPSDLAFYNKGLQLPTFISDNLSTSMMSVLFPAMADESKNPDRVRHYCYRSLSVLTFVVSPVMLGMFIVAEPLVDVLLTSKWLECVPFMRVFCIDCIISLLGVIPLQALKAIGRSDVLLRLEFVKKPAYVLLLLIGLRFDPFAVAVFMLLYDVYSVAVNMRQLSKYLNYRMLQQVTDIIPSLGPTVVMSLVIYFVPVPSTSSLVVLLVKIAIGFAVFVVASKLLRVKDYEYLADMVKKRIQD